LLGFVDEVEDGSDGGVGDGGVACGPFAGLSGGAFADDDGGAVDVSALVGIVVCIGVVFAVLFADDIYFSASFTPGSNTRPGFR
jgi:hypothetical protein